MRYLLPVLVALILTACSKKGTQLEQAYDMPPTSPIPPVDFCFEAKNGNSLQLHVEGDSAFGKIRYSKTANIPEGNFVGIIYGKTLLVSYRYKKDSAWHSEDQQWKLSLDTIYQENNEKLSPFLKVRCK